MITRITTIFFLLVILTSMVLAVIGSPKTAHRRDASITPITSSYADADNLIFIGSELKSHIAVTENSLAEPVAFCLNAADVASCTDQVVLGAGLTMALDDIGLASNVYIRSLSGSINVGKITITVW